jgi:hypothetical protein
MGQTVALPTLYVQKMKTFHAISDLWILSGLHSGILVFGNVQTKKMLLPFPNRNNASLLM